MVIVRHFLKVLQVEREGGVYEVNYLFEDTICDLKLSNFSFVNSNMKSLGKRLRFLLTASFYIISFYRK